MSLTLKSNKSNLAKMMMMMMKTELTRLVEETQSLRGPTQFPLPVGGCTYIFHPSDSPQSTSEQTSALRPKRLVYILIIGRGGGN